MAVFSDPTRRREHPLPYLDSAVISGDADRVYSPCSRSREGSPFGSVEQSICANYPSHHSLMGQPMIEKINDDLTLISTRRFVGYKIIDGGDTVVVLLEGAASEVVTIMMPRAVASDLTRALGEIDF
ncbi:MULTISPECIES: hypothetical protein [Methylobacteriaceae]|uniref:hypothetical protein n=1 Tax=Methylobacteriaceae TaxID=119045 RepID=UPI002F352514